MTVRELLKEILVSGCSLDDQLCLVTKRKRRRGESGPLAEHSMRAMCQPDHVDLTREEGTVIMEFGDDK